jgi:protein-glutamine gamma-glutamyltransferase
VDDRVSAPPPRRNPPSLLPPSAARLGGFAALALLGALQWQRMIEGLPTSHAILWVVVAVCAAIGVLWADARSRWRGTATVAVAVLALLAAYVAAGLDLGLLKPRRLDELGAGLSHGAESLASVQMPYRGADPWPSLTLQLLGAVLCVLAALLAFWPRAERSPSAGAGETSRTQRTSSASTSGYQFISLALLLVLVAAPVVSLGGTAPVTLGLALTALTVCFLWLERLPLRPGLGIAAMLALAIAGALPLASAADGDDPWFDYKAFAERLGPDEPLKFDWGHSYGPITWPRDGAEVLRVDTRRPSYWKIADLDDFDGEGWIDTGENDAGEAAPEFDLARSWQARPAWRQSMRVTLRRIATTDVIGAGTTLSVDDTGRPVHPSGEPGLWDSDTALRGGDSYTVKSYVPRPSPAQLTQSSSGKDARPTVDLDLTIPTETEAPLPPGLDGASDAASQPSEGRELRRMRLRADIRFEPFEPFGQASKPFASYQTLTRSHDGDEALQASGYAETWALAKQLMRRSRTPYDYVAEVNRYLQNGFTYDETPDPVSPGRPTLDGFLFETKSGYCQHFSAAMALLLRMGGVPARVATGFSPGGYSERKHAWIVRDTDAHSWVEVWFDEFGWVTIDPTPAATPARSQIGALDRKQESDESDDESGGAGGSAPRSGGVRPDLLGPQDGQPGGGGAGAATEGGTAWWWFGLAGILVVALGGWLLLRWRRARLGPAAVLDRAIAELEAALRRIGRPGLEGLTLQQLERRLDRSPEAAAYLRALRAARYAPTGDAPTTRGRRALRRELGSGAGPRGRLRALWSLPPWRA